MRSLGLVVTLFVQGCTPRVTADGLDDGESPTPTPAGARHVSELFEGDAARVDVLWVIDASGSMAPERARLGSAIPEFVGTLLESGADFQIAMTSSDSGAPIYVTDPPVLSPAIPSDVLTSKMQGGLEVGSSTIERYFQAASLALSTPVPASSFTAFARDGAALALFFAVDSDDTSPGSVVSHVQNFRSLKPGDPDAVRVYSLSEDPARGCSSASQAQRVREATFLTGGTDANSCESDFSPGLRQLGWDIAEKRTPDVMKLSYEPNLGSIVVLVDGQPIDLGIENWRYDAERNEVEVAAALAQPCSSIEIRYETQQFGADEQITRDKGC